MNKSNLLNVEIENANQNELRTQLKRIYIIDYLRGIGIFTIVLMHLCQGYTNGALNKAFAFGGAGVHVFILCSGLGLYLSYLHKP